MLTEGRNPLSQRVSECRRARGRGGVQSGLRSSSLPSWCLSCCGNVCVGAGDKGPLSPTSPLFTGVRGIGILRSWKVVTLDAHQAPHHPNHQLHGSLLVQALLPYERAPRLEVECESYGGQQRLASLALLIPALGHSILPRPLPVLEDRISELRTKGVHLSVSEHVGEYLLVAPIVSVDLR